jgi:hypothetical protein
MNIFAPIILALFYLSFIRMLETVSVNIHFRNSTRVVCPTMLVKVVGGISLQPHIIRVSPGRGMILYMPKNCFASVHVPNLHQSGGVNQKLVSLAQCHKSPEQTVF